MSNGVVNWLKEIGLDKYIEVFAENWGSRSVTAAYCGRLSPSLASNR
jgi:hypothetical protein